MGCVLRDLLPCPLPYSSDDKLDSGCRSVRRRALRANAWKQWCNAGVSALNSMYYPQFTSSFDQGQKMSLGQNLLLVL